MDYQTRIVIQVILGLEERAERIRREIEDMRARQEPTQLKENLLKSLERRIEVLKSTLPITLRW